VGDRGTNRCPLTIRIAAGLFRAAPGQGSQQGEGAEGQVKKAVGRGTNNLRLEAEGQADQTKTNLKQPAGRSRTPLPRR
jgi:uncharacterized protein YjbJ (UPF0337 family)